MGHKRKVAALTALLLVVSSAATLGHHSFSAEFDVEKPVKVTGVVRKVEWMNPHIWYYVEGTDELSGRSAVWGFSGGSPNSLRRQGISRDSLRIGDTIVVEGFQARDNSANASGGRVTFADGRRVFTAADEDARPR